MDVTIQNFKQQLPEIIQRIEDAEFISFDGEFTGIRAEGASIHGLDDYQERYEKLRRSVKDYLMVQCGICMFQWMPEEKKYISHAYNFYLFPHQFGRHGPDKRFHCQTSSISFLLSQGFDFNKAFRDGVPYMLPEENQKLLDMTKEKHKVADSTQFLSPDKPGSSSKHKSPRTPIPDEQKEFMEGVRKQIEAFVSSEDKELLLKPFSGFQRKLVYEMAQIEFNEQIHMDTRTNEKGMRHQVVCKITSVEEGEQKQKDKQQAELEEVEDTLGFTKVVKEISLSGKLLVGHNMTMDIMHLLHHFIHPLPEKYDDFKEIVHMVFPRVLDTKFMSSTPPLKDMIHCTFLSELQKTLEQPPFTNTNPKIENLEASNGYSSAEDKLHEAGFDAYITGVCFTSMSNYLGFLSEQGKIEDIHADAPVVQPFINKLYVMRTADIPCLNLAADDAELSREHVFHITFPAEWQTSNVHNLFEPFGNVAVYFIDDTSALISLHNKSNTKYVVSTLSKGTSYKISTYWDYKKKQSGPGASHGSHRPFAKRKLPSSDVDLPVKRRKSRGFRHCCVGLVLIWLFSALFIKLVDLSDLPKFSLLSSPLTSPFGTGSDRSITTIVEEDEEASHEKQQESMDVIMAENIGEPVDPASLKITEAKTLPVCPSTDGNSDGKDDEDLFKVPDKW